MITVEGLVVAYGGVVAVRDVSLAVRAGEVTAVLGANGAGKTTTLLAISGLVKARGGSVDLDGTSLLGLPPERIARLGVAHVPAGRGIFPGLSVADNLRMGLYGARRTRDTGAVDEVVDVFPILRERSGQPAGTLSGGQQQQLAIARALVQRPKLLLLDEMSMGLSPTVVADLFGLVRRLADDGMAVVMVEQFVGQALGVADRVVVIEQGAVAAAGAPAELSAADIGAAYLGALSDRELPAAPADVRQDVPLALGGADVRRLDRLAAEQGRPAAEIARELVERGLRS